MASTLEMTRVTRERTRATKDGTRGRDDLRALAHRVGVEAVARALDVFDIIDE